MWSLLLLLPLQRPRCMPIQALVAHFGDHAGTGRLLKSRQYFHECGMSRRGRWQAARPEDLQEGSPDQNTAIEVVVCSALL